VLALATGVLLLAAINEILKPAQALVPAILALAGVVTIARGQRRLPWAVCGATTFAVLFVGVQLLHSAYNRQFALRGKLRTHDDLARHAHLPVVCYPQRWDSVSFYLPRADVRVYSSTERAQMFDDLHSRPNTLVFVKSGEVLRELVRSLPSSLEFVPRGRPGQVATGWIHVRNKPPEGVIAQR
jgi:hypothetical protein